MAKFSKAILKANHTYHSPDGQLHVTPERLEHWAATHKRFSKAGIRVPVSWGHDSDPDNMVPVKFSSDKKHRVPEGTVGYLDSFNVSKDGNSAEIVLDIRGKEDARKCKENLAYVSPVIFEKWKDGDGNVHQDCITHADLVQHPVDHHQTEFEPVVACSLRMGLDTGKPMIYRLQDDPFEEESDESSDDSDSAESSDAVTDDADGMGSSRLAKVIEGLRGRDIVLSEDTTADNFLEHLEQALLTAAAMEGGDEMGMGDELSLATPELAALSLETKRIREHSNTQHRATVAHRLSTLLQTGRCTPAEAKEKNGQLKTVRLSLDNEGNHTPGNIESWIASREAVPQGTFWSDEQKLRLSVEPVPVPHPEDLEGDKMTPEQAKRIANEMLRR